MSSEPHWSRERRVEPGWYVWAPDGSRERFTARLVLTEDGEPLWLGTDHGTGRMMYGPLVLPALPVEWSGK